MRNMTLKKPLIFLLIMSLVLSLSAFVLPVKASAASQSDIDALQSQKDDLQAQQDEVQAAISALNGKQSSVMELKKALDEKNDLTMRQMLNLNEQIELQDELIAQKTEELATAQTAADDQLEKLKGRIRAMEENGRYNYIEVLLGANSISEFLSLMDDIGDIMQSDKELEDSCVDAVTELKTVKADYEQAKDDLVSKKAELQTLSDQLASDMSAADAALSALQGDLSANKELLADLNSQESTVRQQLAEMIKQNEAAQKPSDSGSGSGGSSGGGGSSVGTGSFIWPSYCTYITSMPGGRVNPVTGVAGTHKGVDIGASYGSAIYAADGGTVVTSSDGWNGGWGNYVVINHGNGYTTLYAHMSSRAVSVGATVKQGQVIGYVGSSGQSTGPHLHFEVYKNGSWTDPLSYYNTSGFTYSPTA